MKKKKHQFSTHIIIYQHTLSRWSSNLSSVYPDYFGGSINESYLKTNSKHTAFSLSPFKNKEVLAQHSTNEHSEIHKKAPSLSSLHHSLQAPLRENFLHQNFPIRSPRKSRHKNEISRDFLIATPEKKKNFPSRLVSHNGHFLQRI